MFVPHLRGTNNYELTYSSLHNYTQVYFIKLSLLKYLLRSQPKIDTFIINKILHKSTFYLIKLEKNVFKHFYIYIKRIFLNFTDEISMAFLCLLIFFFIGLCYNKEDNVRNE